MNEETATPSTDTHAEAPVVTPEVAAAPAEGPEEAAPAAPPVGIQAHHTQAPSTPAQAPSVGRVVLYTLGRDALEKEGEIRAADVVGLRSSNGMEADLLIKLDGPHDAHWATHGAWVGNVPFGGPDKPGTWYWPPRQ